MYPSKKLSGSSRSRTKVNRLKTLRELPVEQTFSTHYHHHHHHQGVNTRLNEFSSLEQLECKTTPGRSDKTLAINQQT